MTLRAVDILSEKAIAFHPRLARLTGSIPAGLMLGQALYWTDKTPANTPERDGWFYESQAQWETETALTGRQQLSARLRLKQLGFISEERRGLNPVLWFKVNLQAVEDALLADRAFVDQADAQSAITLPYTEIPSETPIMERPPPSEIPDPPEWLTVLRQATPYRLTTANELALIQTVATLGATTSFLVATAESLVGQWPNPKWKRLDYTFRGWARRGPLNGTSRLQASPPSGRAAAQSDYSGWESVGGAAKSGADSRANPSRPPVDNRPPPR